jgi:DNA-directed RNA polymerase sigma subunit (sigma70/sigma32)
MVEGNSILDKIIASKEDQQKKEFNPVEVIGQLLQQLNDKEADVLKRRYGLAGFAKETLEAIGASYKVTRERIRQIENLAVKKMKQSSNFGALIKPVEHVWSRYSKSMVAL